MDCLKSWWPENEPLVAERERNWCNNTVVWLLDRTQLFEKAACYPKFRSDPTELHQCSITKTAASTVAKANYFAGRGGIVQISAVTLSPRIKNTYTYVQIMQCRHGSLTIVRFSETGNKRRNKNETEEVVILSHGTTINGNYWARCHIAVPLITCIIIRSLLLIPSVSIGKVFMKDIAQWAHVS